MRSIAQRYPLVSYYLLTLILSGIIFALLFAAGLVEGLFFLATFGPGLAAILVSLLVGGGVGVRKLLGRLLIWRVGIQWWLVALLFTFSTIAISVTFTWVFNNTRGSVLIAATLHGATNAWMNYFLTDPAGEVLGITIWSTVLWAVFAVVLLLVCGSEQLSRSVKRQTG